MEVDGSGKIPLGIGYFGSGAEPSHETHGSERLFLTSGVGQSVAVYRPGASPLTLLEPGDDGDWIVNWDGAFRWVFNGASRDGAVSWHAMHPSGDQAVVRADVVFDASTGEILGIDLNSIQHYPGIGERYDWSPDGTMIVFHNYDEQPDEGFVFIFDTLTGTLAPLPIVKAWSSIDWSPDGTRIAYTVLDREQDTTQVNVYDLSDGSITTIASGKIGGAAGGTVVNKPHWSPDSSSLVYVHWERRSFSETQDLIKIRASGKGKAENLTSDLDSGFGTWVLGWREK
jgi:Tol biopolymer transport system component